MWSPLHKGMFLNNSNYGKRRLVKDFLLQKPRINKIDNENVITFSSLEIGHSSMQGYRKTMEDKHIITDFPSAIGHTLIAIMDGHSGSGAAHVTAKRLCSVIEKTAEWQEYINNSNKEVNHDIIIKALVQSFIDMDEELKVYQVARGSGCTCVCAVITPSHIICASVGDSRCVVGSNKTVISMSEDHKPSLPEEMKRIVSAGGRVLYDRVNGELAMSRALGDFQYKSNPDLPFSEQLVICIPDVSVHVRDFAKDEILVLACDGVWDVLSNSDVIVFLTDVVMNMQKRNASETENDGNDENDDNDENERKTKKSKPANRLTAKFKSVELTLNKDENDEKLTCKDMAEAVIELALASGSTDNLSCIVVNLQGSAVP